MLNNKDKKHFMLSFNMIGYVLGHILMFAIGFFGMLALRMLLGF